MALVENQCSTLTKSGVQERGSEDANHAPHCISNRLYHELELSPQKGRFYVTSPYQLAVIENV
jgi:hypothetical protein